METEVLPVEDPGALMWAAELLIDGEVVALPTETVYGLAANALDPVAVAKIFEVKERPSFDPLICHLPNVRWLAKMTTRSDAVDAKLVQALVKRYWPGPLTLVLPKSDIVPDIVTSGLPNVALRLSAHHVVTDLASAIRAPLAAPSANRFGRISPTTAEHVLAELEGRIPLIVDGGPTQHGIESTIVAVEGSALRILRDGPITREELAEFGVIPGRPASANPEAPGQLESHYAPRTPMRLGDGRSGKGRVGFLAWQAAPAGDYAAVEVLSATGDLREAAATLFAKMRRLDAAGLEMIVAEGVPEKGLGVAIMDRLRKASAKGP